MSMFDSGFIAVTCCHENCGLTFHVPPGWYEQRQGNKKSFYCPNGHSQHFIGETEADTMRRERDRLAQRLAERDDAIRKERSRRETAERQLAAQKGVATKLRKRAAAGTCPCCKRTFTNMATHMKREHPDYVKETGANVVQLKRESA